MFGTRLNNTIALMKYPHLIAILFATLLVGCASSSAKRSDTPTASALGGIFSNRELALSMVQDPQTHELTLALMNVSKQPLTNQYPEVMFEGTICLLQEGAVPVTAIGSNYLRVRLVGLWFNRTQVLSPGAALTYKMPIASLTVPFASGKLETHRPVFAYAVMEKLRVASPFIRLNGVDKINYPSAGELLQRGSRPVIGDPAQ